MRKAIENYVEWRKRDPSDIKRWWRRKKTWDKTLNLSLSKDDVDVFSETLDLSKWSWISYNCFKEWDEKVMKIYDLVNANHESHIEGIKHFEDLQ